MIFLSFKPQPPTNDDEVNAILTMYDMLPLTDREITKSKNLFPAFPFLKAYNYYVEIRSMLRFNYLLRKKVFNIITEEEEDETSLANDACLLDENKTSF